MQQLSSVMSKNHKATWFGVSVYKGSQISSDSDSDNQSAAQRQRWRQTRKGKQVVGLGILMSIAYALALLFPDYGVWVFAVAVIAGFTHLHAKL